MNDIPERAQESKAPSSSLQARPRSANVGRIALIVALVLLVAAAASIGAAVLIKNTNTTTETAVTIPILATPALPATAVATFLFPVKPVLPGTTTPSPLP